MGLTKHLKGKSAFGIVLCIIFFFIIFGYGVRSWKACDGKYCFFGPQKTALQVEICHAEEKVLPHDAPTVR